MSETFETYCKEYFNRLAGGNNIQTNQDTARERDKNISSNRKSRAFIVVGKNIKSEGADVISSSGLDEAMVRAFQGVPLPAGRELAVEYHFLMHVSQGMYTPSKFFEMPDNGGAVNYSCQLGHKIDWSSVVAAGHTHPLYKDKPTVNRLNKYFSAGDPSILIIKQIPLYLRTPDGKQIKVMEIRSGWVTTREVTPGKVSKPEIWKARG